MEDISRELERELKTHSKPAPFKRTRKKKVIVVDDFGEMTSGQWIKTMNWFLLIVSVVFFAATGVFYYLYSHLSVQYETALEKQHTMESRIDFLTSEKELLMAKLVILENRLGEKTGELPSQEDKQEQVAETNPPESEAVAEQKPGAVEQDMVEESEKTVSIEEFQVLKDGKNGDLLVRFDIRNVSKQSGEVAGYIFTVLKPESTDTDKWLVVPSTPLENGIPGIYKKGQYFAIAHYKPVKFRIKNQSDPDFYTNALIFVFNTSGRLIFQKQIDITEAE